MSDKKILDLYQNCNLCPRNCNVNRKEKRGFCLESDQVSIDAALLHFGEEPPISFKNGSGTIFFTGCSLRCPFCQNMQISQNPRNKKIYNLEQFIDIIITLIKKNAENINFVTPDHFLPHIIEAIKYIKKMGYDIPFIYNCSGYQSVYNLELSIPYIDIYLFDYKFANKEASLYCLKNEEYPKIALEGLKFIYKNKGNLTLKNGKAIKGTLVRHLVMPNFIENSIEVINNLYFTFGNTIFLSVMSQYTPTFLKKGFEKINRKITKKEYETVIDLIKNLSFKNVYLQEYIEGDDRYIPDFDRKNMFDEW
ncbi:MAG TPA: 4Fe-4S cluster-binding domain-containing protein [Spirochaetota bacterium]|nr:4Fe-4S cluster-binding domain-containing protein [Spirochaetota bacterium]HOL55995.1 4Fe-4S cluster-binding domain-containing protein [Spirochaetota bacterium]HPP03437.1 4Fe-4S cluster-binding domain-containing protein [Spirochaetota bacterium]